MAINSKIILAKNIHIDRDYKNVLNYTTNEMIALLNSNDHFVNGSNKFSYIRSQNRLSTPFSYEECFQSNYIAFQNPSYENKWFFAFIDDVYYKSNGCTEISFTVDAWHTFWEDWSVAPCLTVREHVSDDTIGLHTLDEGLEFGDDFITELTSTLSGFSDYFYVAVETNYTPNDNSHRRSSNVGDPDGEQYNTITVHNKNVFGTDIVLFDTTDEDQTHGEFTFAYNLAMFLSRVNDDEHIGDVRNIYIIPHSLIPAVDLVQHTAYNSVDSSISFTFYTVNGSTTAKTFNQNITKQHSFTGFTPKNNKCYCYPYNFIEVTNNSGNRNIYKYEQFSGANASFKIALALGVGCSGRLTPTNYKNQAENHDEDLALGKFPTCAWSSDAYINYLTQESVNNIKNIVFTGAGAIMNSLGSYANALGGMSPTGETPSSGGGSVAMSGASGLLSMAKIGVDMIGQRIARDMAPENYAGSNTGTVAFSDNLLTFVFKNKRVKTENLQIIDDYFTKFGYKVSRLKTPELASRRYWNYVEIAQSEDIGFGDVPTKYMEEINNICRRGVTIWHNHANIGNYNLSNTIIN